MNRRILLALLVLAAAAGPLDTIAADGKGGRVYPPDLLFAALALACAAAQVRGGRAMLFSRQFLAGPFHALRRHGPWRIARVLTSCTLVLLLVALALIGRGGSLLLLLPSGIRALRRRCARREQRTLRDGVALAFACLVFLGSPAALAGALAATLIFAALLAGSGAAGPARSARTAAWAVPATAVAAALLFLFLPRFEGEAAEEPSAAAERREQAGRDSILRGGEAVAVTALRRVSIGDIGRLQQDFRPLLEVEVIRRGARADAEDLGPLFRGGALEEFDGTTWRSEDPSVLRRDAADGVVDGFASVHPRRLPAGEAVTQRLRFLVGGTDSLFCLGMPTAVGGEDSSGSVRLLPRGEVRAADIYSDGARFTIRSVAVPGEYALVDAEALSDERRARLLRVPPGHQRAVAWARSTLSGAGGGTRLLRRVESALESQCTYSLDRLPTPGQTAVEGFLFTGRQGHCELFASAAAVMLRAVGVPSRVVIGFRGGTWDPAAKKYLLRGADAHAWTEAWIAGEGWRTLDATPAARRPAAADEAAADGAAAGEDPSGSVLRYDAEFQRRVLAGIVRLGGDAVRTALFDAAGRLRGGVLAVVLLSALGLVAAVVLRRAGRAEAPRPGAPAAPPPPPEAWARLLRTLAASGIHRGAAETASELAARAVSAGAAPVDAVLAVAAAYSEERWGGRAPDAAGRAAARTLADSVSLPGARSTPA